MTLTLIRRYLREPMQWMYLVPAFATMLGGATGLGVATLIPFLLLLAIALPHRATMFEASLPINARSFITARLLATLAVTWTALAVGIISLERHGIDRATRWITDPLLGGSDATGVRLATLVCVLSIAMLTPFVIRPTLITSPPKRIVALAWLAVSGVGALAMRFLSPVVALPLALLGFAVSVVQVFRIAPLAFQLASLRIARGDSAAINTRFAGMRNGAGANHWIWPVLRSGVTPLLLVSALLMIFGGATGIWLTIFTIFIGTAMQVLRPQTLWLRSLPLSNRARLLALIGPIFTLNAGAFAIGRLVGEPLMPAELRSMGAWSPNKSTGNRFDRNESNVSLTYWQTTKQHTLPIVTAPWGETAAADTISYFGTEFFNPYSSSAINTKLFVDWQIERASVAVYGFRIPANQYDPEKPLPTRVTRSLRMTILNWSVAITFALLLVFLAEIQRWHKVTQSKLWLNLLAVPIGFVPIVVMFLDGLYQPKRGTQFVIPMTEKLLLRWVPILPSNVFLLTLLALIPVLLMFRLAEWQFSQAETPMALRRVVR